MCKLQLAASKKCLILILQHLYGNEHSGVVVNESHVRCVSSIGDECAVLLLLSKRNRRILLRFDVSSIFAPVQFSALLARVFRLGSVTNMSAGGAKSWVSNEKRMNFNNFDIRIRSDDFCFLTFQKNYPDVRIHGELQ